MDHTGRVPMPNRITGVAARPLGRRRIFVRQGEWDAILRTREYTPDELARIAAVVRDVHDPQGRI